MSVPRKGTDPQAMQWNLVRCICASISSREEAQNSFLLLLACLHLLQANWYRYMKGSFWLLTQNSPVSRYHKGMKSNPKTSAEYQNFENLLKRVVQVPHSEIKAKLEEEKRAKKKKRPKTSGASRD